jgi:predicted enzyme related to lactoylglutathione lyase
MQCGNWNNQEEKLKSWKSPVPGMGYFAICTDTEDNTFAISEKNNSAK